MISYLLFGEHIVATLHEWEFWPSLKHGFSENGSVPTPEFYARAVERALAYLVLISGFCVFVSLAFRSHGDGIARGDRSTPRQLSPALRDAWLLAVLMVIAVALRLPGLNLGLWRDEASTFFEASAADPASVVEIVKYAELNPPAYYLITHFMIGIFGTGELALKIAPFLFGLLAIPASYALGRVAGSRAAALFAAALTTLSPVGIYYAQEARPNTLAALLSCLVTLFLLKSFDSRQRGGYLVAFVLCASLLIYVQYTGLMLLVSLALATAVLVILRRREIPALPYVIAGVAIFALYLPWIPVFFAHLATGTPWTPENEWLDQPRAVIKNVAYMLPWTGEKSILAKATLGMATLIALAVLVFSVFRVFRSDRNTVAEDREIRGAFVLGTAILGPVLLLAWLSLTGRYMFSFIPIASAFFGVWLARAGRLAEERGWRWLQPLPAGLAALFVWTLVYLWDFATLDRLPKSGIPAFVAEAGVDPDDTLYLFNPDFLAPTFGYYTRDLDVPMFGFARLQDPHIFKPADYAEMWNRDEAVEETLELIRAKSREGFERLALVEGGNCKELEDKGQMRYSRVWELRAAVDDAYAPLTTTSYPARSECVAVTMYDLQTPR
ncbi:glycosyltransferase family 39 protein [Ruegeria marisrubri]|uniref:glycosyltransferase family 39 protein n=1 Tax=Ruegeria marisrubri TaxID=1685379 RepID=UPI0012FD1DDC|nr:glycosyltransferase family 39 protein [Ruegeria marisrubri]